MKKASILILSLVATLTACSPNSDVTGATMYSDWFEMQRNTLGLSDEQKNTVINYNDGAIMVTRYVTFRQEFYWGGSGFVPYDFGTTTYTFTRTTINFDKDGEASVALGAYTSNDDVFDPNLFQNKFVIGKSGSDYVFTAGPTEGCATNAEKLYFDLYDSFFEWGITLLSGAHFCLATQGGAESYVPHQTIIRATNQKLLEKEVVSNSITTYRLTGPSGEFVHNNNHYSLGSYCAKYVCNRLNTFDCEVNYYHQVLGSEKTIMNVAISYISINYVNV